MKSIESVAWLACLATLFSLSHLDAQETAVVKDAHVNVRGQPSLVGEVITQLQKGEKVVVLEEVPALRSKTNEPAKWARIEMPAKTPVWVYAPLIDPATKSVKARRLNLRAGPGENYSVVGRLQNGATVTEIRRVEDWMEIETPPGAYGFVAANLLTKSPEAAPAVAKAEPAQPPPAVAPVPQPAQPVPQPNRQPEAQPVPPPTDTESNLAQKQATNPLQAAAAAENPEPATKAPPRNPLAKPSVATAPPLIAAVPTAAPAPSRSPMATAPTRKAEPVLERRVVRREGLVRSTVSIQAPTYYELLNPENRKTINYLHADGLDIKLKDYRNRRIVVTGEEAIDPRWPKTPVIEVESLELIP